MSHVRAVQPDLLHVFHAEGLESFPPVRAVFNHYVGADGRTLFVVHLRCGKAKAGIEEFERLFHPEPFLDVVFHRPPGEESLAVGDVLTLPVGYDYEYGENITDFYYATHEAIEDVRLEVISWSPTSARLRLDGLTGAAHESEDTRIALDVLFVHDPTLKRSFS